MSRLILCLLLPLLLVRCGDLPQPFLGNPGANGRVLAQPPTPRLLIPAPANALLPDAASQAFATKLADALQAQEVPAVATGGQPAGWRLVASATQRGDAVVPAFTVLNPQGKEQGKVEGAPVPTADWAAASAATLGQSAMEAAPKISLLLTNIETARQHADPNNLYNRQAKVMVADVTGAPGDGNVVLTRQMRTRLAALGPAVQTTPDGADFTVQGRVKAVPTANRQERIEIQWTVTSASGDERGKVVQLNEIPAGTLDHYWGDVAVVVATEASGGVNDVLLRQTGHAPGAAPGAAPEAAPEAASDAQKPVTVRGHDSEPLLEGPRPSAGLSAR